jgi:hypothetical protein
MPPVDSYMRTQGIMCAVINMVLNPLVAWLGHRQMDFVPLWGGNGMLVDTAVTSVVLSLLVTLFMTAGVRQALQAGRFTVGDSLPPGARRLAPLPRRAWPLGLLLGLGLACILTPLTFGLFWGLGLSGLPFAGFALFKALYTGPLGYAVTRWVILRQLLGNGSDTSGAAS